MNDRLRRVWHWLVDHRAAIGFPLIPVIVMAIAFSPVLFGGRTLSTASFSVGSNGFGPFPGQKTVDVARLYQLDTGASAWQFEPWAEVTHRIEGSGELPLWNPYQGSGAPLAANMQSAPFDPLFAVVNFHPTPWTWDLSLICSFVVAAVATYAFARIIGLGYLAAVTSSVTYGMSGYFFTYSNNHFSVVYVYLPILCLLVEWVLRSGKLLAAFVLAVAAAACITVGMPEIQLFVFLTAGGYGLWRLIAGPRSKSRPESLALLAAGFGCGAALSAPQLLLFHEYQALSFNVHRTGDRVGDITFPLQYLVGWFFPFLDGYPVRSTSTQYLSGTQDWIGGAVAFVALVGAASRRSIARLIVPFFAVVIVLVIAKTYGFGPIQWVGRLPIFQLTNFPRYSLPAAGFGIAILAGLGVDSIRHRQVNGFVLAGLVAGLLALVLYAFSQDLDVLRVISGGQALHQVGVGVAAALLIAVCVILFRAKPAAFVAMGVVIIELLVLAPGANGYAKRADPFVAPAWLSLIKDRASATPYDRMFGLDALLFPNDAGAFGMYDIRALDALYVDRYWQYVHTFIEPQAFSRFIGGPYGVPEETTPANYENNPMFDLLGVRFLAARLPLTATSSPMQGTAQWTSVGSEDGVNVFENRRVAPRAFVATSVQTVKNTNAVKDWFASRSTRFSDGALDVNGVVDPMRTAVIEAKPSVVPPDVTGATCSSPANATIKSYKGDKVTVSVDATCPGLLVLSDTYYPGWTATVNGKGRSIHPTDIALRGVFVGAGHSEVVFTYAPKSFRHGLVLAAFGFLALPLLALVRLVRRRRRSSATVE